MKLRPFRQELKFLVHHSLKRQLMARWERYLLPAPFTNKHAVTPILSQYYDSPDLTFYREKLDGISLRNKVRLRVYGLDYQAGMTAFLEIKHRQGDLVRKYREQIEDFGPHHLDPTTWAPRAKVMESALLTLLERHRLAATAQVYYQREAWEGAVEPDVRVTWDTMLTALHPHEKLTRDLIDNPHRQMMAETLSVLEVKATKGIPPWVNDGVLAAELRQQTIPKYITAVERLGLPDLYTPGIYA